MAVKEPLTMTGQQAAELRANALKISAEIGEIEQAIDRLAVAYSNAGFAGKFPREESTQRMYDSDTFTILNDRREQLRRAFVELG
jgi:hypothetical protein